MVLLDGTRFIHRGTAKDDPGSLSRFLGSKRIRGQAWWRAPQKVDNRCSSAGSSPVVGHL